MNELKISPFCRNLRTKKSFFLKHPPRTADELLEASGHCWCSLTGHTVGDDGEPADPEDCVTGRRCFAAYGAPRG